MSRYLFKKMGDEEKKVILIISLLTLQWIIFLQLAFDPITGIWSMSNPDTMCTLSVARSWIQGHPLQIIPGEPASTILSDLLSPIFFTAGYWLGFKSLSGFVLWAYIEYFILALFSTLFLWKFFKKFVPDVAFPATLLSIIFSGIFSNLFSTNFGFLFLFFWGALAFIDSLPLFMTFSVLAALMRPEGLVIYIFLVTLRLLHVRNDGARKFIPPILIICVPFLVYKNITGSYLPQGVTPQNIIHYHGYLKGLEIALSVIFDQIKGGLLGLYSSTQKIGAFESGWLGSLPPFLFIFSILGFVKHKREWLFPVTGFLLFLIAGDAFSLYSGAHQNRHFHVLTPFFFGFALIFFRDIKGNWKPVYMISIIFFFIFNSLQFYGSLFPFKQNVEKFVQHKKVVDYLVKQRPKTPVLAHSMGPLYWSDGRLKLHLLYVSTDPYLGKYVKYYIRILETTEYIQRFYSQKVIFLDFFENTPESNWLRQIKGEIVKTFQYKYKNFAEVKIIDLGEIKDSPPYRNPYSELDVGDPFSEEECGYKFIQSLEEHVDAGILKGENFWDGGRPNVIKEDFYMDVPENRGILVCRYKGLFTGGVLTENISHSVNLFIKESDLKIHVDEEIIFNESVSQGEDFFYLEIPLKKGGRCHFKIEGLIHSFHYWVYSKGD